MTEYYSFSVSLPPAIPEAWSLDGYCAYKVPVEEETLSQPRSLMLSPWSTESGGDLWVLDRDKSAVLLLQDMDDDGLLDTTNTLVTYPAGDDGVGLSHGLMWYDDYLYASSPGQVMRWPYEFGSTLTSLDSDNYEIVINGISEDGNGGAPLGHRTRTLIFGDNGLLYVAIGSNQNIDMDSYRARVRRFNISDTSLYPLDFAEGEIYADGLRNTVGMAFDANGTLWGVDAGPDNLMRDDLGGDIHNDNPGEEFNMLPEKNFGLHYGYPYCWSEGFELEAGNGPGTQFAWPSFMDEYTDEYCRNTDNNVPPKAVMPAHSSPLGVTFYKWNENLPESCDASLAFPKEMDGYAFIAYHGSWNRLIPTGYKVVYFEMDADGNAIGEAKDLLKHEPPNAKWGWGFRPVDVAFDRCGRLYISSDGTYSVGGGTVVQMVASDNCGEANERLSLLDRILLWLRYLLDFLVNTF